MLAFSKSAAVALVALLIPGWVGLAGTVQAQESYTTYDNFNGSELLDPTRWQFFERRRVVSNGVLNLVHRDLGNQVDDTGTYANSWGLTPTVSPGLIRQLRATVTVKKAEVTGCAQNPQPSDVQARLIGAFFNTGVATPGDRTNDVGALVRITRRSNSADPPGVLRVEGVIFRCTDSNCVGPTVVLVGNAVDMGTVNEGQALVLRMDWDQNGNRFLFRRGPDVYSASYLGLVSVGSAPGVNFKALQTRTILANCLSGSRTVGFVDADFDNVYLNSSALNP